MKRKTKIKLIKLSVKKVEQEIRDYCLLMMLNCQHITQTHFQYQEENSRTFTVYSMLT